MNHRERVLMALNHEQPDRCPMQISFTPEFAGRLRQQLRSGWQDRATIRTAAETPTIWSLRIDEDMLLTSVGWANCYYQDSEALHR